MLSELSVLFDQYRDAVVAAESGVIRYRNLPALDIFPGMTVGERADGYIPPELLGQEGEGFVMSLTIGSSRYSCTAASIDGMRVYTLTPGSPLEDRRLIARTGSILGSDISTLRAANELLLRSLDDNGSAKQREYAAVITRMCYQLSRTSMNMASADKAFSPKRQLFDAVELCAKLVDSVSFMIKDRGIELRLETHSREIGFYGDEALIERMLLGLISNSIKYTERGGSIVISAESRGQYLKLAVKDTGSGIHPSKLGGIFNGGSGRIDLSDASAGTGFGLSIVSKIAAAHEGTVLLESREGEGTAVTVSMPFRKAPPELRDSGCIKYGDSETETLLTELADVLPLDCYRSKYLD